MSPPARPRISLAARSAPVELRLADGRRRTPQMNAAAQVGLLAEVLHDGRPGVVEVVGATRTRDGRLTGFRRKDPGNFTPAGDRQALLARVRELCVGERREVFMTPATLGRPQPLNEAVLESAVLWVDIDDPARLALLRAFPHRPHAVVASGSGGMHAYWRLAEPLRSERCDEANRKLAAALGADLQSCNRGRIMRVPGTLNWKRSEQGDPCALVMCDLARAPYDPEQVLAGLRDPRGAEPARAPRRRSPRYRPAEPWQEMEPADYYRLLVGTEPGRDGTIRCPSAAHEDRHPSARLYAGPGSGWFCFACGAGGGAVDMVAALRGWPTGRALRQERFGECVAELRRVFGVEDPSEGGKAGGG